MVRSSTALIRPVEARYGSRQHLGQVWLVLVRSWLGLVRSGSVVATAGMAATR